MRICCDYHLTGYLLRALAFYDWVNRYALAFSQERGPSAAFIQHCSSLSFRKCWGEVHLTIPWYTHVCRWGPGNFILLKSKWGCPYLNRSASFWATVSYSHQLIASFRSTSGTTELHHLHWHTVAGWSAIGLHRHMSSSSDIFFSASAFGETQSWVCGLYIYL